MNKEDFILYNPWWQIAEAINHDPVLEEFNQQKLHYFHPFYDTFPLNSDAIFILRGPRQVGKSTLVKLLIKKLVEQKVIPDNVFFFPADRIKDYNELFTLILDYLKLIRAENNNRIYLFIDEITSVDAWQKSIKQLADLGYLKNVTTTLTGSNALDLYQSGELMPGRRGKILSTDIEIMPLSYREYVNLINPAFINQEEKFYAYHLHKLHGYLKKYLITGGFPKTINEYETSGLIHPATFKIYESWVMGDLLKQGKMEEMALNIIKRLIAHLTTPFSYYSVAKKTGINSHMTVIEYLDILEKIFFLIKLVPFSIDQKQSFPQKNKKAYFYDPLIYNVFRVVLENYLDNALSYIKNQIITETQIPQYAENLVAIELKRHSDKLYYGKLQDKEIDFVEFSKGHYSYYEVKYQNNPSENEFSFFNKTLPLTVITKNTYHRSNNLLFIPLEVFLLVH